MPTDLGKKMLREIAKRGYTGASREVFFKKLRGIGYPRLEAEVLALEREGYIKIEWVGPNDFTVSITKKGVDTLDPKHRKDWFEKTKGEVAPEEFDAGVETSEDSESREDNPEQTETEGQSDEEQYPSDTDPEAKGPEYEDPPPEQYDSPSDMPAEETTAPSEETEPEQQEPEQQEYEQQDPEQEEPEQQEYEQQEPEQQDPEQEEPEQQDETGESIDQRTIPPPPDDEDGSVQNSNNPSSKSGNNSYESKQSQKVEFGFDISVEKTLDEMIREELESALKGVEEAIRSQDEELRAKAILSGEPIETFSVCFWNDKRVCRLARIKEVAGRYDLLPLYCIACKLNEKE